MLVYRAIYCKTSFRIWQKRKLKIVCIYIRIYDTATLPYSIQLNSKLLLLQHPLHNGFYTAIHSGSRASRPPAIRPANQPTNHPNHQSIPPTNHPYYHKINRKQPQIMLTAHKQLRSVCPPICLSCYGRSYIHLYTRM